MLACVLFLCGSIRTIPGGFPAGDAYVVKEDVLLLYSAIPPELPQAGSKQGKGNHEGFVYGNVIIGRPMSNNAQWIEIESPRKGFVLASGIEREVDYKKIQGQSLATQDEVTVRLLPDAKSRKVLSLFKGEVVPVTGVYSGNNGTWYRYEFSSDQSYRTYIGASLTRVGWIIEQEVVQLDPGLDQGSLQLAEIPERVRGEGKKTYSDEERSLLAKRGFYSQKIDKVLRDLNVDDMVDLYHQRRSGPSFVTADLYLHIFHLLFDRMLQDIEAKRLLPGVKKLTTAMYGASEKRYAAATTDTMRTAAKRNMWFFGVAGRLMDARFTVSSVVAKDVESETGKIIDANAKPPSMDKQDTSHNYLPGFNEDYTQYKPRGHYNSNNDFQNYFRVMMHYGRKSFMLEDESCTLSAMLMTQDLQESRLFANWDNLSKVIDHLAGTMNDASPNKYAAIMEKVYGTTPAGRNFGDGNKIRTFVELTKKELAPQRIVSQKTRITASEPPMSQQIRLDKTAGFKFISQRYSLDAELIQRLTSPSVGNQTIAKTLPSGLEVMALLGSKEAKDLIRRDWWASVPRYPQAFQEAKSMVDSYSGSAWGVSASMGWFRTLQSLFLPPESKQFFINAGAWGYISLNSALSSWTELKHDTILYPAHPYSEVGGVEGYRPSAGYEPPSIKGYVEPVPTFFSRLSSLNAKILQVLDQTGYQTNEYKSKLTTFGELTARAGNIARKEVSGRHITADDYDWIDSLAYRLDRSLLLPEGIGHGDIDQKFLQMALVTDVATDADTGEVLLEAIGYPDELYVMVKDYWGGSRIAKGFIYTHYEFADSKRWTDEDWKELVYSDAERRKLIKREPPWYAKMRKQPAR
jgi:hypothetical protein